MKIIKSLATIILVCVIMFSSKAQVWFDAGLKAAYGPSMLFNSNIFSDASYNQKVTFDFAVGGKFGTHFGWNNGITIDAMISQNTQPFEYSLVDQAGIFSNEVRWNNFDFYLMWNHNPAGTYFELGPQVSLVRRVEQFDVNVHQTFSDESENYNDLMYGAALGFGGYFLNAQSFSLTVGFRASYMISDFISEAGMAAEYPNPVKRAAYDSYTSTNPFTFQIMVEANFGIGFFAKTKCSDRPTFFSF